MTSASRCDIMNLTLISQASSEADAAKEILMKYRRILSAAIAAVIALSGCSGDTDQPDMPVKNDNTLSPEVYDAPSAEENGGGEQVFTDSATRLSVTEGSLEINRRTRSASEADVENSWTILVYLCGTDLESDNGDASLDIIEAVNAQYSENVHIVYQTGGTNEWKFGFSTSSIQRYENINYDIMLVDEVPDASMGSADTLADFISWGIEKYPAEKMGLILWNHGGGSISGVCFDEKNEGDSLSLREIDSALNSVYEEMGDKFEFIGFDACLMSTLETANILVPYARYMFASEELEPGCGWNYTDIMTYLAENPEAEGAELGQMQCKSYYQHCIDGGDYEGATFAITDLSKIDELLISFDKTAKEMYESEDIADISRAVQKADNFGGNNRSEGYTNMVDLKGLLNAAKPYAPNAEDTLEKLENAVIFSVFGPQHEGAGGLSLYYPLSVQGSTELSTFADICTSSYYLALVDKTAYGTTGGDIFGYDNSYLTEDCEDLWSCGYNADENAGASSGGFNSYDENSFINVDSVYFDEDGIYTVQLSDTTYFSFATCSLFAEFEGVSVYLGEDDDVITDWDNMTIQDNFNGNWPSLGGIPLAIQAVCVSDRLSVFTCPVLFNGEQTNLRIEYDYDMREWAVIGAWAGIDPATGAAARETVRLKDGDVITPLYLAIADEDSSYIEGPSYTVNGEAEIDYYPLFDGNFSYSMTLYDIFGNYCYMPSITFEIDENGDIYIDRSEL